MLLFIIVPSILCCVYAWRRRQKYLEGKLPPICVGAWPIIGHAHLWLRGLFWPRLLDMQKDCLEQGGVTYLHSGPNTLYTYYGQTWENHRSLLEPVFDQMGDRLQVFNHQTKILNQALLLKVHKGQFDQTEYLRDATMKIVLRLTFGTIEENEIIDSHKEIFKEISDVLYERHRSFFKHKKLFFRWSKLKRRQDECVRSLKALTNGIITRKREEFRTETEPVTLLDFLLRLELRGIYSEQSIMDELNGVIFGGYNTVVHSLTFILVMIGSHNAVQERVDTEINNVLGDSTRDVNMEDLNNFTYLHAVIVEVLRLYPAVPMVSRKTQQSVELKKYTMDPGTKCLLFIYAMNRHQSWGADSEEFKPERWLDGSTQQLIGTFGLGRRSCIGMKVAINIMKMIVIYILREYKVIADHSKLVFKQELLLTPESGHFIALEKR